MIKTSFFLLLWGSLLAGSTLLAAPAKAGKVDLDGDGKAEMVMLTPKAGADGTSVEVWAEWSGQRVLLKGLEPEEALPELDLQVAAVSPRGGKKQWLQVSVIGASDFQQYSFLGLADGALAEVARLEGQGEVTFPGNGSALQKVWMGFWTRTLKHEVTAAEGLRLLEPEFYHVGVKGRVLKTFELKLNRKDGGVLARPRVGSDVELLAYHRDPAKSNGEDDEISDWYLVKTETGLMGWVQMGTLRDEGVLELPWAG